MTPGRVSVIHTFWAKLNWNPHIHFIVTAGGINVNSSLPTRKPTLKKYMSYHYFKKTWRALLAKELRAYAARNFTDKQQSRFSSLIDNLFQKERCVFVSRRKATNSKTLVGYLWRYIKRPVIGISRIIHYDSQFITYSYFDKNHQKELTNTVTAEQFIGLLMRHIPDKHLKYIRYWGLFANRCKQRYLRFISTLQTNKTIRPRYVPRSYGERLRKEFGTHPLVCPCWWRFYITQIYYPRDIDPI